MPLGIDEQGREVLGYIDGDVPVSGRSRLWKPSDEALVEVGGLIRRFHDASRGFVAPESSWQRLPGAPEGSEVVCHNDLAPYNTVYRRDRPVGFIDWDYAAPGLRVWDLAHAAWRYVPLGPQTPVADGARRLRVLCDAYGLDRRGQLIDYIARRQQALHDTVRQFAALGIPPFVAMWGTRHSEQPLRDRLHLLAHRDEYEAALG